MDKELLKGIIDFVILLLAAKNDVYGYQIAKEIKCSTNSLYEIGEGTIYLALKRMESKSLITSYWEDDDSTSKKKKYYKITEEGLAELAKKKNDWKIINDLVQSHIGGQLDD